MMPIDPSLNPSPDPDPAPAPAAPAKRPRRSAAEIAREKEAKAAPAAFGAPPSPPPPPPTAGEAALPSIGGIVQDAQMPLPLPLPNGNPPLEGTLMVITGFVCVCHTRTNRFPVTWAAGDVIPVSHQDYNHLISAHAEHLTRWVLR